MTKDGKGFFSAKRAKELKELNLAEFCFGSCWGESSSVLISDSFLFLMAEIVFAFKYSCSKQWTDLTGKCSK